MFPEESEHEEKEEGKERRCRWLGKYGSSEKNGHMKGEREGGRVDLETTQNVFFYCPSAFSFM
jgi:hypothetical protein